MSYLKENFGYLILSFIVSSIVLIGFTMSDEMKAGKVIRDQDVSGCASLSFPWIRQTCLKRIYEKKVETCYFEECKLENKEILKKIKSPLLSQLFCLILFLFSTLLFADYLKKVFGKFREDNYFTLYIDQLDHWMATRGLTRENLLKTGFRYEMIYFLIFCSIFSLWWGLFSLVFHV